VALKLVFIHQERAWANGPTGHPFAWPGTAYPRQSAVPNHLYPSVLVSGVRQLLGMRLVRKIIGNSTQPRQITHQDLLTQTPAVLN